MCQLATRLLALANRMCCLIPADIGRIDANSRPDLLRCVFFDGASKTEKKKPTTTNEKYSMHSACSDNDEAEKNCRKRKSLCISQSRSQEGSQCECESSFCYLPKQFAMHKQVFLYSAKKSRHTRGFKAASAETKLPRRAEAKTPPCSTTQTAVCYYR